MTLLLAAIAPDSIVLGADGVLTFYYPGGQEVVGERALKKLFLRDGFPAGIAHHGQNRFVQPGEPLPMGKPVAEMIDAFMANYTGGPSLHEIADSMQKKFAIDISYTRECLTAIHVKNTAVGFWIAGFGPDRPHVVELLWRQGPVPDRTKDVNIAITQFPLQGTTDIVRAGFGNIFAQQAIANHGSWYKAERLVRATVTQAQEYVRRLYRKATELQGAQQVFGGAYHELTVTKEGPKWTTPAEEL